MQLRKNIKIITFKAQIAYLGNNDTITGSLLGLLEVFTDFNKFQNNKRLNELKSEALQSLFFYNDILRKEILLLDAVYEKAGVEVTVKSGLKPMIVDWNFNFILSAAGMRYVCLLDSLVIRAQGLNSVPNWKNNFNTAINPKYFNPNSVNIMNDTYHPEWASTYVYEAGRFISRLSTHILREKAKSKRVQHANNNS